MSAFNTWVAKARAIPIEDEIARRGIKLQGTVERCGPCPKCAGDDRFGVSTRKQLWHCRQCSIGGDVIELVKHLDDVDFIAACTTLTGEPPPKANGKDRSTQHREVVAGEFPYQDADGNTVFVVERRELQNADGTFVTKDGKRKKTIKQKRPDPDRPGKWLWNVDGVPVLPYRLPHAKGYYRSQFEDAWSRYVP